MKSCGILLFVAMSLFSHVSTASAATVTVEIPSVVAAVGQKDIAVPVQVSDLTGLSVLAIELVIAYDAQMVTATGVDVTDTLSQDALIVSNIQTDVGRINIALTLASLFKGSGELLRILFDTVPEAQGQSFIQILTANLNEGEGLTANTTDGAIIIQGSSPSPPPSISDVLPTTGPVAGGTLITIRGADFQFGVTVQVGGNPATGVTFVNATTLTATTPAGNPGAADVVVTNPDHQSATRTAGFTYTSPDQPFTASAGTDQSVAEGTALNFAGSFSDPDNLNPHLASWDFGDGVTADGTLTPSHTYLDDGDYTVILTVSNDAEETVTDTLQVTVNNVPPTFSISQTGPQPEGTPIQFTLEVNDPGVEDTFLIAFDWEGDGIDDVTGLTELTTSHTWSSDGRYLVRVRVTDDDGGSATEQVTVVVSDLGPSTSFTWLPETPLAGETVQFTDTSTSSPDVIAGWLWDFGDGSSSDEQHPNHSYAGGGSYRVVLTVTDADGSSHSRSQTVMVSSVELNVDAGIDQTVDEGQAVSFQGSFIAVQPDGNYTSRWDFGDGVTADGTLTPSHTYLDDGDYTVILSITDEGGNVGTDTLQVTVNNVPPAIQRTDEPTGIEGSAISFRATVSDPGVLDTLSISWDFGDGTNALDSLTPQHTYTDDGNYAVRLTVSDDDGGVRTDSFTVRVANAPPEVSAGDDRIADIGQPILFEGIFSDAGSEDVHTIEWDFGDGTSVANDLTPQHAYAEAGIYTVRITVTDDAGDQGTDTLTVRVNRANTLPSIITEDTYFGVENTPIQFTVRVEDDDLAGTSYEVQGLPFADGNEDPEDDAIVTDLNEGIGFNFAWTPPFSTVSKATGLQSFYLTVVAEDSTGNTVSKLIELVVRHVDVAPILIVPEQIQAEPGETVRFSVQASDDGDTFLFAHQPADIGQLEIDPDVPSQVTFTWDTTGVQSTVYPIQFQVTDSDGLVTSAKTQIRVLRANQPPQLVNAPEGEPWIRDYTVDEGTSFTIANIYAEDPDPEDALTWEVEVTPTWLDVSQIDAGILVGNPGYGDAGEYRFLLTVTDSGSPPLSTSQEILVVVNDVNRLPILTVEGEQHLTPAEQLAIRLVAEDPDPDNVQFTYVITPLASWMAFDAEQGLLTNQDQPRPGTYLLTASVTDSAGGTTTQALVITVDNVTEPPEQPQIETVQVAPTMPINIGAEVTVTVTGRPGQTGTFTIPGVPGATNLALAEAADGVYQGSYEVQPGDQAIGTNVTVALVARDGSEATQTSAEKLHIDTEALLRDATLIPLTLSNGHAYTLTVRSEGGATVTADLSQVDMFQASPIPLQPDSIVPLGTETSFSATAVMNPDNTVANGSYPITLTAVDAAGNEATTLLIAQVFNEPAPVVDTTPPSPVQLAASEMVISASDRSLRWAASEDAESGIIGYEYVLDRTPDQQIDGTWLPTGSLDAVLELPPLLDGTYEIWIRARNGSGLASTPARVTISVDQTPPLPASGFRAESLPGAMVRLSWIASPSLDVVSYHVYTTGADGLLDYMTPIASVIHPQTSWQSGQLPENVLRTFALRAVDAAGNEERNLTLRVDDVIVTQNEPPKAVSITLPADALGGDIEFGYMLEDREGDLLSVDTEYSTDHGTTWHAATVKGPTRLIASHEYQGSLTWRSGEDLSGVIDAQVLLKLTPHDRFAGQPAVSTAIHVTNILADTDGDQRIGLADLERFVLALRSGDLRYDIGPAVGQPPDLRPLRDGKMDFEDLAVFVLMWNWSYRQEQSGAAPLDPIAYIMLHDPELAVVLGLVSYPTQTRLLPNYPNPFNPETWIPYELAQDAEVQVRIFDMTGRLVRQFRLGMQPAGAYRDRSRALHWDGQNQAGEHIAAGTYYCQFRANNLTTIRTLTIAK